MVVEFEFADVGIGRRYNPTDLLLIDAFFRIAELVVLAGFYFNDDQCIFIFGYNVQFFLT